MVKIIGMETILDPAVTSRAFKLTILIQYRNGHRIQDKPRKSVSTLKLVVSKTTKEKEVRTKTVSREKDVNN